MSTVLWANALVNGKVESDESDLYALYQHSRKLGKLSRALKVTDFEASQDFTDARFNLSNEELPDGMVSTDALMAAQGAWIPGTAAVEMLERLILHIRTQKVKFGLLGNDADPVLAELNESLKTANKAKHAGAMFNFSVVL